MVYCYVIGQFSYIGEISVLAQLKCETALSTPTRKNVVSDVLWQITVWKEMIY